METITNLYDPEEGKVYREDGSTFTLEEGTPLAAKVAGVAARVAADDRSMLELGRSLISLRSLQDDLLVALPPSTRESVKGDGRRTAFAAWCTILGVPPYRRSRAIAHASMVGRLQDKGVQGAESLPPSVTAALKSVTAGRKGKAGKPHKVLATIAKEGKVLTASAVEAFAPDDGGKGGGGTPPSTPPDSGGNRTPGKGASVEGVITLIRSYSEQGSPLDYGSVTPDDIREAIATLEEWLANADNFSDRGPLPSGPLPELTADDVL